MTSRFFFPYLGGKWGESRTIYNAVNLDDIDTIVEPFCGSCAFSLYGKIKEKITDKKYVLNDTDTHLIDFLKDVKEGNLNTYIDYCNDNAQSYFDDIKLWRAQVNNKTFTGLNNWFVTKKLSRGHMLSRYSKNKDTNKHRFIDIDKYRKQEAFFKSGNVELSNVDYKEIFDKYTDVENALLFLDPPYFDSYNSMYCGFNQVSHTYDNDNTKMYVDIVKLLKSCNCSVVMIISKNALTDYLFGDYVVGIYEHTYQLTKKKTKHLIIYKGKKPICKNNLRVSGKCMVKDFDEKIVIDVRV